MSDLGNKEIFSKNLKYYMTVNNKDRNDVCRDLGFAYTTFAEWYNGNIYPRIDKIEILANYFNIRKSDLVESKEKNDNISLYSAQDDAMYPLLDIGDIAYVYRQNNIDETNPSSNNAGTYLIEIDNQQTIRRFIESQDKTYYTLQGMNISYKPINIKKEELQEKITILGKVIRVENSSAFK